jgi:hypothetical protein
VKGAAPVFASTVENVPTKAPVASASATDVPERFSPDMATGVASTATCRLANHVLLIRLLSPGDVANPVNLTISHCTHVVGTTGICAVSIARGAIVVVLVQVTTWRTAALHDRQLVENGDEGAVTHDATVILIV